MATKTGTKRALIYCRVSHDKSHGRSVSEQEAECREFCTREGWSVVDVIADNSVGASRHSKGKRSGWDQALRQITSGDIDALVTWEASRAARDLAVLAPLRDTCAQHGVVWAYKGRVHDFSRGDDRFTAGLDGLIAEREAQDISDRVKRAERRQAEAGRPRGRRLYGFQRTYDPQTGQLVGQAPHPEEAPIVHRIFREYLKGKGTRTIASALNDDGLQRTIERGRNKGKQIDWSEQQVRRTIRNPAYAGRRVFQGEVVGDAVWDPLIDPDEFDRCNLRLDGKKQKRSPRTPRLLTGIGRCGVCGAKLRVTRQKGDRLSYQCRENFCVGRDQQRVDEYVATAIVEWLSQPESAERLKGGGEVPAETVAAKAEADRLQARLDEAVDAYSEGDLSMKALTALEKKLEPQIADLKAQARQALVPIDIDVPADHIEEWWNGLDLEQCREVAGIVFEAVVLHKAGRGRRTFDPDKVELVWR